MLLRLRHDSLVGRDHEEGDVDARRSREHVADKPLVPWDASDARLDLVAERQRGEAQVDRDPAALLLLPSVGVDSGEGLYERRLAVVDVAGGADYEAADGTGVGGVEAHARRSQKSRAERAPVSPKWWRKKRATRRRWAEPCFASSQGNSSLSAVSAYWSRLASSNAASVCSSRVSRK